MLPWKRNNAFRFYCWRMCVAVHSVIVNESFATKYSNSFPALCYRQHGTHFGLHVKCPLRLFDFNQILSFSTDFPNSLQYQISRKSVHLEPRWYVRTQRRFSLFTRRCLKQCLKWLLVYWIRIKIKYNSTITYRNNKFSVILSGTFISMRLLSFWHYTRFCKLYTAHCDSLFIRFALFRLWICAGTDIKLTGCYDRTL